MTENGAVKTPYAQVTKGDLRFKQRTKRLLGLLFLFLFFPFLKKSRSAMYRYCYKFARR